MFPVKFKAVIWKAENNNQPAREGLWDVSLSDYVGTTIDFSPSVSAFSLLFSWSVQFLMYCSVPLAEKVPILELIACEKVRFATGLKIMESLELKLNGYCKTSIGSFAYGSTKSLNKYVKRLSLSPSSFTFSQKCNSKYMPISSIDLYRLKTPGR